MDHETTARLFPTGSADRGGESAGGWIRVVRVWNCHETNFIIQNPKETNPWYY